MTTSIFAQLAAEYAPERNWTQRPVEWSGAKTGLVPWSRQREIMESVRDNRYTAVRSAHDLGKSKIAAEVMAWWIDSHPIGEAFVVSTAPSAAQVSAILWREVSKAHRAANLPGRINRAGYPQWYFDAELVGYGRKPADYEDSAFQGIHAKYVLVVIDEACGVSQSLYNAVDALVTNEFCRVLAIGNPDNPGSHFASICKPGTAAGAGWHVIALDGLESPNMTEDAIVGPDPDNPRYPLTDALMRSEGIPYSTEEIPEDIRPYLLSPLWVEERIQRWAGVGTTEAETLTDDELQKTVARRCAGSSLFTAKVRGVFPPSTLDGVIPLAWIQFAVDRWRRYMDRHAPDGPDLNADYSHVPNPTRFVLGVDVARGGEDETVFAPRYGDLVPVLRRYRLADTMETADAAAVYLHEPGSLAVVDVIGIGAGVFDTLRRRGREGLLGQGVSIMPFVASGASWRTDAIGAFRFFNDRAAAWWRMRESLDPSRSSTLMLPDDERLLEELVAPRWRHLANGVIQVESKDEIRKRLGRSTDSADAVIQAFWPSGRVFADPDKAMRENDLQRRSRRPSPQTAYYPPAHDPFTDDDFRHAIADATPHPSGADVAHALEELLEIANAPKAPADYGKTEPEPTVTDWEVP